MVPVNPVWPKLSFEAQVQLGQDRPQFVVYQNLNHAYF